jgi:hypothetical protein
MPTTTTETSTAPPAPAVHTTGLTRMFGSVAADTVRPQLRRSAMFIALPNRTGQAPEGRDASVRWPDTSRPSGAWPAWSLAG